jgi:Uma2 family endonuclease
MAKLNRRATYEDLQRLPEHLVGEIIEGELIVTPRPASPHARAASAVGGVLWEPFDRSSKGGPGPGGWWIVFEPELHLGPNVMVPDVAGWRRERMPKMPNVASFELAPDWACEVVSPSTERIDRAKKMNLYARAKVQHLWLVNPLVRTLEIYQLDGERWSLLATHEGDERVRPTPFDAIEVELVHWWIETDEPAPTE